MILFRLPGASKCWYRRVCSAGVVIVVFMTDWSSSLVGPKYWGDSVSSLAGRPPLPAGWFVSPVSRCLSPSRHDQHHPLTNPVTVNMKSNLSVLLLVFTTISGKVTIATLLNRISVVLIVTGPVPVERNWINIFIKTSVIPCYRTPSLWSTIL